jgi:ribosomal protein S18 acetylase RimI-like enzyme
VDIEGFTEDDRDWAYALLFPYGGEPRIASRQTLYNPFDLPGFVAWRDGKRIGLVTYRPDGDEWEILTLDSDVQDVGAGTALIEAVKEKARASGAKRVWLITTNDNTHALRFYQRRGMRIREVRPGAVDRERETIKPEISMLGNDDIPIRDEIELVIDV